LLDFLQEVRHTNSLSYAANRVTLTANFEEIAKWLDANGNTGQVDIDAVAELKNPLSKQ
jgi:hypothetical protein